MSIRHARRTRNFFTCCFYSIFSFGTDVAIRRAKEKTQSIYDYTHQEFSGGTTMTPTTNSAVKTATREQTAVSAQAEVSRGAVLTLGATGAVIGLWAFASLIGGLVAAGGPVSLVQSWVGAIIGM